MICPKCSASMELVRQGSTTVDRCIECGGIWFDSLEAEDLLDTENGSSVDVGSKLKGFQMDRIRDIQCPKCRKQMQTVSDREDPTLKFEVCTDCHGYFLDAGEFRDMAHVTSAEKISETLLEKAKQFIYTFQAMHMKDRPE